MEGLFEKMQEWLAVYGLTPETASRGYQSFAAPHFACPGDLEADRVSVKNPDMRRKPSLSLVMPSVPSQRWSCHSCGHCCRTLVIHLFDKDREKIDGQEWSGHIDVEPYVRAGGEFVLNKRSDGGCVFLDENNMCRIHARYGADAKPLACRIFPFSVRPVRRGWQASLRYDCPSAAASKGEGLDKAVEWLGPLLGQLYHVSPQEGTVDLRRGLRATREENATVVTRLMRWLDSGRLSLADRLIGAARITSTLTNATLENVRGKRLTELLDLLFAALAGECADRPAAPTERQRGMLRQLVFAHAEHLSLAELRAGGLSGLRRRGRQLIYARRFLKGKGRVPTLPGAREQVRFDAIESIASPLEGAEDIENLLGRYVTARLSSDSVFGRGYYGWPVLTGLAALWLSIAATGWLARHKAAMDGRDSICFDDAAHALGVVDRAATRSPALGTTAERIRLAYLSHHEGMARLVSFYAPLEQPA